MINFRFLDVVLRHYHWLLIIVIMLPAILEIEPQYIFLFGLLLFLPLTDPEFRVVEIQSFCLVSYFVWAGCISSILIVHSVLPEVSIYLLPSFAYVAIPEEWFFRAYLMKKIRLGWRSFIIISFIFALTHYIYKGTFDAWFVFIPSLIYCWYYQRYNDLVGVILLHTTSNIIYALWIRL